MLKNVNEDKPRQILVKFSNYRARQRVFKAKSRLRKKGRNPKQPWAVGNSEFTPAEGEVSNDQPNKYSGVFLNEDLTKLRANLLWKARCKKKR